MRPCARRRLQAERRWRSGCWSVVDVAVHPGAFFGFAEHNRIVLSLLPQPEVFAAGIAALIAEAQQSRD